MKHIKTLKIDIDKKNFEVIPSVQYDSNTRFLHIQLLNDSVPLDITGCSVVLSGVKEDGNPIFNSCDIINSKIGFIQAEVTEQMNAIPGYIDCEVKIYDGEGVLTSKKFTIKVTATQTSRAVESTGEFKALTDALSKAQSINNKRDKSVKIKRADLDTSSDANKIGLNNLADEVQRAMAGNSPVNPTIPNGGVTTEKYAENSVTNTKLRTGVRNISVLLSNGSNLPEFISSEERFVLKKGSHDIIVYVGGVAYPGIQEIDLDLTRTSGTSAGVILFNPTTKEFSVEDWGANINTYGEDRVIFAYFRRSGGKYYPTMPCPYKVDGKHYGIFDENEMQLLMNGEISITYAGGITNGITEQAASVNGYQAVDLNINKAFWVRDKRGIEYYNNWGKATDGSGNVATNLVNGMPTPNPEKPDASYGNFDLTTGTISARIFHNDCLIIDNGSLVIKNYKSIGKLDIVLIGCKYGTIQFGVFANILNNERSRANYKDIVKINDKFKPNGMQEIKNILQITSIASSKENISVEKFGNDVILTMRNTNYFYANNGAEYLIDESLGNSITPSDDMDIIQWGNRVFKVKIPHNACLVADLSTKKMRIAYNTGQVLPQEIIIARVYQGVVTHGYVRLWENVYGSGDSSANPTFAYYREPIKMSKDNNKNLYITLIDIWLHQLGKEIYFNAPVKNPAWNMPLIRDESVGVQNENGYEFKIPHNKCLMYDPITNELFITSYNDNMTQSLKYWLVARCHNGNLTGGMLLEAYNTVRFETIDKVLAETVGDVSAIEDRIVKKVADNYKAIDSRLTALESTPPGSGGGTVTPGEARINYNHLTTPKSIPKIVAHRGLSHYAPENSLPAYVLAGQYGFWGAECDIHETADGDFVLMHDNTIDRTTNGTGNVRDYTVSELKEFIIDAGSNIDQYPGLRIPTLGEYLQVCKQYGIVPVIEIKSMDSLSATKFLNIVKKWGFEHCAVIISFNKSTCKTIRDLNENIIIQWLADLNVDNINYCATQNMQIDSVNSTVTKELVEYAHSRGVLVNTWTVNASVDAYNFIKDGVDYITTDIVPYKQTIANSDMELIRVKTTEDIKKYIHSSLAETTDLEVFGGEYKIYNNGLIEINDTASTKGVLSIPLPKDVVNGDVLTIAADFIQKGGITKPKIGVDFYSSASSWELRQYVECKTSNEWETLELQMICRDTPTADINSRHEVVLGTFGADISHFIIKNIRIIINRK